MGWFAFVILALCFSVQTLANVSRDTHNYDQFLFNQNTLPPTSTRRRRGKRTDGAVVVLNGKTIYEKYARGFTPDRIHIMWSTSKTVMALLYGVAMQEHKVRLDQSICDFVAAQKNGQCAITLRDLLQWSSALDWNEEYERGNILASSVINMLYGAGHRDMAGYVLQHPLEKSVKPGASWRYSSGDSILLSNILQKVFAVSDLRLVFQKKLFSPLGVTDAVWESDDAGTIGGAFYFYCSARDLAKIGEVFLHHGRVNGVQLVAPEFIDFMESAPPSFTMSRPADEHIHHVSGAHIWINKAAGKPGDPLYVPVSWPYAPSDTVATIGHWGQFLVVIPSMNLIAVRIGDTRDNSFTINDFVEQTVNFAQGKPVTVKQLPAATPNSAVHIAGPVHVAASPGLIWKFKAAPLALGYEAMAACSCLFVTKSSSARCRDFAFVDQIPNVELSIDRNRHRVRAAIPWLSAIFHETAKLRSPEKGCVLE